MRKAELLRAVSAGAAGVAVADASGGITVAVHSTAFKTRDANSTAIIAEVFAVLAIASSIATYSVARTVVGAVHARNGGKLRAIVALVAISAQAGAV